MKILCIVGARPNFIKIAPLIREIQQSKKSSFVLVHTGQHYDYQMSQKFFEELGIPKPDINLEVREPTNSQQTGEIIKKFETVCLQEKPDWVVVVGDVNSTIGCTLTASYLGIRIAHIEAGLRSFDRSMPEEINRVVTDQLASALFTTELSANKNLQNEGRSKKSIHFVGNIMIDTLITNLPKIQLSPLPAKLSNNSCQYGLVTLHRPSNVDNKTTLKKRLVLLKKLAGLTPIVFPIHPRTMRNIRDWNLERLLMPLTVLEPQGYIDFLRLLLDAKFVLTDSGGIQEEATYLNIPCVTLRTTTERPITITSGTNILVGDDNKLAYKTVAKIITNPTPTSLKIPKWDGKTAKRILKILETKFYYG